MRQPGLRGVDDGGAEGQHAGKRPARALLCWRFDLGFEVKFFPKRGPQNKTATKTQTAGGNFVPKTATHTEEEEEMVV